MRHVKQMKKLVALLLFALPVLAAPPAEEKVRPEDTGSVETLEVTNVTREVASLWVRTLLPAVAKGYKQKFSGEVGLANVAIPTKGPVMVMVQTKPGSRTSEAVFFVDVKLSDVPEELASRIGTKALDIHFKGSLAGENGSTARVCAVGVLRLGTTDVKAPYSFLESFVKFGGARLTGLSLTETKGAGKVVLYNPFSFPLSVKSVAYGIEANGQKLGNGGKEAFQIHGGRESEISLPISAPNASLVAAAGSLLRTGGTIDGLLTGAIAIKAGNGAITIPLKMPGRIDLAR